MRLQRALVFVPVASAFVITDTDIFERIGKAERKLVDSAKEALHRIPLQDVFEQSEDILGDAIERGVAGVKSAGKGAYRKMHEAGWDMESWLNDPLEDMEMDEVFIGPNAHEEDSSDDLFEDFVEDFEDEDCAEHDKPLQHGEPPHHGPPRHGPPHHKKPHHPPHHKPSNLTVYELISRSNYTTKLAKLIDEYPDLVETLNGTKANYTVFAPIDSAFEKIPHHGHKPSKEDIEKVLLYHVSEDFYPAARVLHSYTIPTLYEPKLLGHKQRLTVRVTSKGPAVNFYSKLIAVNIFGTNGVIHGVDSILVPPPSVASIIDLLPGEFSTLELGLEKTGLFDKINSTDYPHSGGTFFAPSNFAFKKLGPRVNAFLFSKYGQRYLEALLKYHLVVNQTLYTDAFFDSSSGAADETSKGGYQFNLPTLLDDKYLFVSIKRFGPFVSIRLNGYSRVTFHDGIASDGVIQVVSDVLIPPKKPKDGDSREAYWAGEEMSVAELKERLDPYVEDNLEL